MGSQCEAVGQDTSEVVVAGENTSEEVATVNKMMSLSLCWVFLCVQMSDSSPRAESDPQLLNFPRSRVDSLLGQSLLRRSSSLTVNPLLDPVGSSLDTLARDDQFAGRNLLNSRQGNPNIMTLLKSFPKFTVLVRALTITDLALSLETGGPFTLFAPTNLAFDTVGRDKMLSDVAGLRKVLLRHISRTKLPSLSFPGGVSQVDMASNEKLTIVVLNGWIGLYSSRGAAEIVSTDSYAANGIVHAVDAVI